MPNTTTNFGLKKPLGNEYYDINVQNENSDKIDAALKARQDEITAHKNSSSAHSAEYITYTKGIGNDSNSNVKKALDDLDDRIDNLVADAGNSNLEIVDARDNMEGTTYPTLKDRLDEEHNEVIELLAKKATITELQAVASGSPKGTYATLAALQTAYPSGTNGIYVVVADGKWYYWNGSAWTPGGVYQSTTFADGTVTVPMLSQDTADYLKKTKVDNILLNTNFPDLTNWATVLTTNVTASGGVVTFTPTAQFGQVKQDTAINSITGHKYYVAAKVQTSKNTILVNLARQSNGSIIGSKLHSGSGVYELISFVATATDVSALQFKVHETASSSFSPISVKEPVLVNLTQIFGAGNEPTTTEFEDLIKKYLNTPYINDVAYLPLFIGDVFRLNSPLDKKADRLVLTNKVLNGSFDGSTNWTYQLATGSMSGNEAIFTATSQFGQLRQDLGTSVTANKYYVSAQIKSNSNNVRLQLIRSDTGDAFTEVSHSGSGNYESLSFIATPTLSTAFRVRLIDFRFSAFTEIRAKQVVVINLTDMFGAGNEPTVIDFEKMIKKYNNNSLYFNNNLLTNVLLSEVYQPPNSPVVSSMLPVYINRTGDVIKVNSKYNATQDMRVRFEKKGPNTIFDFSQFHLIDNATSFTSNDLIGGTLLLTNGTDFLGPHIVKATSNVNGDLTSSFDFTGGNHGYSGSFTGTATGRTLSIDLFVDGRKVSDFTGYANYIDIYWVNRVQATNTKKSDGTGREVLEENFHLHFDGIKWSVKSRIEFLENVTWEKYYGIQVSNLAWNSSIFYHSSTNRKWNALNVSTDSTDKRCNRMTLRKNNDYLEMSLSESIGIGNKEFQTAFPYGAFSTTSDKSYFFMVSGSNSFSTGDSVSYEGSYRFYSK